MTGLLDAALAYAARGWPVFPCAPGAKTPAGHLVPHGVLDATTDPARIRTWWQQLPGANVAIATGGRGPDVIDVDVKDGGSGWDALAAINSASLVDNAGCYVTTPSGGLHMYFTGSDQRNGSLRKRHVDFRATGGYVIAPPSVVDGRPYTGATGIEERGPVDWAAIRALLDPPPEFTQPARPERGHDGALRPGDDWAASTSWAQILQPHGWRLVRQLGSGRACWCRPGKPGPFTSATTRDDGGLYVFSTSTEFEPEVPYTKFGAWALLEHGGDHAAAARTLRAAGYGDQAVTTVTAQPAQPPSSQQDGAEQWWAPIAARHVPVDWQQLFDDTPGDEDWIIEPLLAAGRSVALYSLPKAGKSLITLEICAALAAGRPVIGQPASQPRKVLYVDLENTRRDIRDRLTGLGYKPQDLAGLIYLSFPSLPMLDSAEGGREITALAIAHHADVVIIDTVSRVISGKENDADTFNALYRYAMAPLKNLGIAVMRLDHAGKDIGKGQRGSSAKNADVDAVWTLNAAGPVITLNCEMSRTPLETQRISLRRMKDPLRHEITTQATAAADRVRALIGKLDELAVPRDWGAPRCLRKLNEAAVPVDKTLLAEAIRVRKMTVKLPESDSGGTSAGNLPEDHQAGSSETAEIPGQAYLEDQQAGTGTGTGATLPNLPGAGGHPEGVPLRRQVQAPQAASPVCTGCGERLPHEGRPCSRPGAAT